MICSLNHTRLKPGMAGVTQSLDEMRALLRENLKDKRVRYVAEQVVRRAPGGNRVAEAREIFNFVLKRVRYTRDPSSVELLQDPRILLERIERQGWAAGDCDDHALMIAALGHQLSLPIVWVLLGPEKNVYEHIYAAMEQPNGELLALDTAVPDPVFGKHHAANARLVVRALQGV